MTESRDSAATGSRGPAVTSSRDSAASRDAAATGSQDAAASRDSAATGTEASLGELERLVSGQHHDPHSILGAHPGPDGIVVRALRPLARSVTLVLDDGRRVPMTHLYQGVFTVTLPELREGAGLPHRHLVLPGRGGRDGGRGPVPLPASAQRVRPVPDRGRPARGAVAGPGRARARGRPGYRGVLRRLGAERPRGARDRRLQLLGRPRVPDALARRVGRVGAVHPGRGRRRPVQVRGLRLRRGVAGQGRPARSFRRAAAGHRVGGVHVPVCVGGFDPGWRPGRRARRSASR